MLNCNVSLTSEKLSLLDDLLQRVLDIKLSLLDGLLQRVLDTKEDD